MKRIFLFVFSSLCLFANAQESVPASIYDFKVPALNGSVIDFSQYKGKVIMVVNTPTDGDYNPYYGLLEATYQKYKDRLVIVGFLDEDFGTPPGSRKYPEVREKHYNVSFPLASKVAVKGPAMAPLYKWLTSQKYNNLKNSEIKWDFQKYLINEEGKLVAVFDPKVKPDNPKILAIIGQ